MVKMKLLACIAGLALSGLTAGGVALASGSTLVAIGSGGLRLDGPAARNLAVVTGDGAAKDIQITVDDFTVIDARGTGGGWHVTIQASQFTTGGELPHILPPGSLSMTQPSVAKVDESSSAVPLAENGSYAIDLGSAVQIASADVGEGMGSYRFVFPGPLTVRIGSGAHPGTYSSTITILVVSGP
jgi:hypothetical protein